MHLCCLTYRAFGVHSYHQTMAAMPMRPHARQIPHRIHRIPWPVVVVVVVVPFPFPTSLQRSLPRTPISSPTMVHQQQLEPSPTLSVACSLIHRRMLHRVRAVHPSIAHPGHLHTRLMTGSDASTRSTECTGQMQRHQSNHVSSPHGQQPVCIPRDSAPRRRIELLLDEGWCRVRRRGLAVGPAACMKGQRVCCRSIVGHLRLFCEQIPGLLHLQAGTNASAILPTRE